MQKLSGEEAKGIYKKALWARNLVAGNTNNISNPPFTGILTDSSLLRKLFSKFSPERLIDTLDDAILTHHNGPSLKGYIRPALGWFPEGTSGTEMPLYKTLLKSLKLTQRLNPNKRRLASRLVESIEGMYRHTPASYDSKFMSELHTENKIKALTYLKELLS